MTRNMKNNYTLLIDKLDGFTRKYYQNQILRGIIYFVAIVLAAFIFSSVLEYYGHFGSAVRTVLFFGLLGSSLYLFARLILMPGLKLFRLGKQISYEKAALIIGKHFPDIEDKLLNTLQLQRQASTNQGGDVSLLLASIDQRIERLQPIPFTAAVDFGENRKYLRYVIPPVLLAAILLIIAPAILRDGAKRIVTYDVAYIPAAPFDFVIENPKLEVPLNEDFQLVIQAEGSYYPSEMSISLDGKPLRLKSLGAGKFSHTFRNVREEIPFALTADGFSSEPHLLNVLPTPSIVNFDVSFIFPEYLGKKNETITNTGNLRVPEGTRIEWKFSTQNTESLFLGFGDSILFIQPEKKSQFAYQRQVFSNEFYQVAALNEIVGGKDTIAYRIEVIKDSHPKISVEETRDSTDNQQAYFGGSLSDDYGLTRLFFYYTIRRQNVDAEDMRLAISISRQTVQEFFHYQNFDQLNLAPGDQVEYYFEVWDNDGINGNKATRSAKKIYKAPTLEELKNERNEASDKTKDQLEESIKKASELQKELAELNKDVLQKKELSWQEKKRIEDVLKKQKELEKNIDNLKNERKSSQQKQEKFLQQSESIMEKQRQLEKMFDELMSDEMKELYKKLEDLMQQLDQEQIREKLDEMKMDNEQLEKELDRTLEIFKQMEFEMEFEQTMQKLEELAKKQEDLAANEEMTEEEKKAAQDELNKEFDQVKEEMADLNEKNEDLERPNEMPDTADMEESISQEMEKASEELGNKKEKKAAESQQKAADEMQDMAGQMQQAMAAQQSESAEEDMDALRALLENIIQLSFDQEDIMEDLKVIDRDDPKYVLMGQKQKKLQDDSKMVEDSLYALSKRVVQIEPIITEEITQINKNIARAIEDMGERITASATSRQQYAMTSYNNLALLLDEALKQMQMQMASQMPGTGNCEKPGGKGAKPSSGKSMSKMQEEMGKKLEQMQKGMQKGQKPGDRKPGQGGQGMSEEIAKMAAEQGAIRREIEKLAQELNERGKGEGKGLEDAAEKMEEIEKDLVNQNITPETIRRQQEILSRLLESEKAEREREYDNQRESNSPKEIPVSNPEEYLEYKKRKAREVELLRTVPPDLKPYYKDRVNDYFLNFEN